MKNIIILFLLLLALIDYTAYSQDELIITYPTAGVELEPGTEVLVEWTGDTTRYKFDLKYSLDNGDIWHGIANNHTKSSVLWEVPDTLTNNCIMKVSQYPLVEAEPKEEWVRSFGGLGEEYALDVVAADDGSFLVIGHTESSDGDLTKDPGERNLLLVKYSSSGELLWHKSYGGADNDGGKKGIQLDDGNFIVLGYAGSDNQSENEHFGLHDAWILKIDDDGEIIWSKTFGGNGTDTFYDLLELDNGDLLVVGTTSSNEGDIIAPYGPPDITLNLIDFEGDLLWTKSFGGNLTERDPKLIKNGDFYFITGTTLSSNGQIVSTENGLLDYFSLKLDNEFNFISSNSYGGSKYEYAMGSIPNNNGGVTIIGQTSSYDGDVKDIPGNFKFGRSWFVDINKNGSINHSKSLEIPFDSFAKSIIRYEENEILIAGYARGEYNKGFENTGNIEAFLTKTDDIGNILWYISKAGYNFDVFYSIKLDPNKDIIAVGRDHGDNEQDNFDSNVLIAKYSETKTNSATYTMDKPFSIVKPVLSVEKEIIDVGSVLINSTKDTVVNKVICNEGTANFVLLDVEIENDSYPFQVLMQNYVLPPNECSNIEISFSPTEVIDYQANLTLVSKSNTYSKVISLIGNGFEEEPEIYDFNFSASPNPSSDIIFLSIILSEATKGNLTMYDTEGKKIKTIYSGQLNKGLNTKQVKASNFSSGRYFITYEDENINKTIPIEILN